MKKIKFIAIVIILTVLLQCIVLAATITGTTIINPTDFNYLEYNVVGVKINGNAFTMTSLGKEDTPSMRVNVVVDLDKVPLLVVDVGSINAEFSLLYEDFGNDPGVRYDFFTGELDTPNYKPGDASVLGVHTVNLAERHGWSGEREIRIRIYIYTDHNDLSKANTFNSISFKEFKTEKPVTASPADSRVYKGNKSLEFKVAGTCLAYHTATLEVGKTYTFSAWVMHPEKGAKVSMNSVRWIGAWGGSESHDALFTYAEHNNEGGHIYEENPLITDGTWQKAWYTFTIPEKSGDPMVGDHVSPGTSPYYSLSIDIRGKGTIYIDEVWLIDNANPNVNLIEDGGFENAVVGPNEKYFGGADWRGANLVKVGSKYWWPQYGYEVDGSGSISPFAIISVDTAVNENPVSQNNPPVDNGNVDVNKPTIDTNSPAADNTPAPDNTPVADNTPVGTTKPSSPPSVKTGDTNMILFVILGFVGIVASVVIIKKRNTAK